MVNKITEFIHEYDFDFSVLENHKESIIQEYLIRKQENPNLTDVHITPTIPDIKKICTDLNRLVQKYYYTGDPLGEASLRVYVQTNEFNTSKLHDHIAMLGTIQGVFYLNPPKKGGELKFRYLENKEWGKETIIQPQINKLILFPYWLPHVPLPQQDSTPRLCFNWVYTNNQRPIHKFTGDVW